MKRMVIVKLSVLLFIVISPANEPSSPDSALPGMFVATSPCDAVSKALLKIPETADCELIKWDLKLHSNPGTRVSDRFELNYVYGLPRQGTNGIAQGGVRVKRKGKWTAVRGTKAIPDAVVYRLDPDKPQDSVSFQVIDDNLLHLLDRNDSLMPGNAAWSYTLSRVGTPDQRLPNTAVFPASPITTGSAISPAFPVMTDSPVLGVFVGRSPCRDLATELNKPVSDDCTKLKWELTLYRDPVKDIPTTYKLKGTFYRERVGEGRCVIVKGTKTDPDAVVYQLNLNSPPGALFLLKADDNILFFLDRERNLMAGNADFSYTLNRTNDVRRDVEDSSSALQIRMPGRV